jgi:anhydro-N-acetylmuramic acid kinase
MQKQFAIGVMSGTSLDGLDVAFCAFTKISGHWKYEIISVETLEYPKEWELRLRNAPTMSGIELTQLHNDYGHFIGQAVNNFIIHNQVEQPGIIASHGHTVFHRPDLGYTLQVGSGAAIAAETGLKVVCDFRSLDVALGGQGAPLVPIGDQLLFPEFDYCLNLGGFANISHQKDGIRLAYDICPVNFVINKLVREASIPKNHKPADMPGNTEVLSYDPEGSIARKGKVVHELLQQLNQLPYYQTPGPKSLGEEWVKAQFLPVLEKFNFPVEDLLCTIYEHIATQLAGCVGQQQQARMLVTGGGAYNHFLIERMQEHLGNQTRVVIPEKKLVDFKEAMVFAFLGILRLQQHPNCLASVTGSRFDNIGGAVYNGKT